MQLSIKIKLVPGVSSALESTKLANKLAQFLEAKGDQLPTLEDFLFNTMKVRDFDDFIYNH
jgi:hypothetical protein